MASYGVMTKIANKPELYKKLDELSSKATKRAMQDAFNRTKTFAKNEVARKVSGRYNIKAGEVKPAGGKTGGSIKAGGSWLSTRGTTVADLTLIYRGRRLTPLHFGMKVKGSNTSHTISAQIIRGHKVTIGHHSPPYSEGGRYNRGANSPYWNVAKFGLPFQREAGQAKPSKVFRTVSIKQMVEHEEVGPPATEEIAKYAFNRLTDNMKRFLG